MNGLLWSDYEKARLRDLSAAGYSHRQIGNYLRRTPDAVKTKASKLGFRVTRRDLIEAPPGDPADWTEAERISAWARVPKKLAEMVVDGAGSIPLKRLRSSARTNELVEARLCIISKALNEGFALSAIGRALNRDHTTIRHHREKLSA